METKIVDEETRYDRQVRLWGASTQRRLKLTHIYFDGIAGPSSEMAKNLALAGVNSIVVKDSNTITESDYHNNFLVQSSRVEADDKNKRRRGSVAATTLRSLNPFVHIKCDVQEEEEEEEVEYLQESMHTEKNDKDDNLPISDMGSKDGILVCVVQVKTLQEMHTAISRFAQAEMVLLSYTIDKTTVATFILYANHDNEKEESELVEDVAKSNVVNRNNNNNYQTKKHIFGKQLHSLLYDVNRTERLPRQMQRALLHLHLSEIMHTSNVNSNDCCVRNAHKTKNKKITTSSVMACAMNIVEMLKLYALTPEDIAASVTYVTHLCTCADTSSSTNCDFMIYHQTDAITATMCGAALAQFLILQIGSLEIQNDHNNEQKNNVHDDNHVCTVDKANRTRKYNSQWLLCDGVLPAVMIDQ